MCKEPQLISMRSKYLCELRQMHTECYDTVHLDESQINTHHTNEKEWQSTDRKIKRHVPSRKRQRLILAHYGSKNNGLLTIVEIIFYSKSTDNHNYHKKDD